MSYTPWDQQQQMPLLINTDLNANSIGPAFVSKTRRTLWILWGIFAFFLAVGGVLMTLAFVLEGPSGGLFWAFCAPAIVMLSFALTFFLINPFVHCAADASIKSFNRWQQSPVTVSWTPADFTHGLWQQFQQEEFGAQGRSLVKYDWKKYLEIFLYWIFLMAICTGAALLRMAIDHHTDSIGGLPWAAFCAILGVGIGTLTTLIVYVTPEIVLFFKKRDYAEGPQAFIASPEGMFFMGQYYNFDPTNTGCCTTFATLEHRRLNNYQMRMAPCLEFCFSNVRKNGKYFTFLRIPVPPSKMEEASAFINGHFAQPAQNAGVWAEHLKDYAKELEDSAVVQIVHS